MKSVNELLDDLAQELHQLRHSVRLRTDDFVENEIFPEQFNRAQQLVGYIRQKLKDEQWKPQ